MNLDSLEFVVGLVVVTVGLTTAVVTWFFVRHLANVNSKAEAERAKLELEKAKLEERVSKQRAQPTAQEREAAEELRRLAQNQHLSSVGTEEDRRVPAELRARGVPLFVLPRCTPGDLDDVKQVGYSTLDIICWENEIGRGWRYDRRRNAAQLLLTIASREVIAVEVLLDASDASVLSGPTAVAGNWFLSTVGTDSLSIIKIQFQNSSSKFVSLYWANYAIERWLESKARELSDDWDFDMTLGGVIGPHVGRQDA